MAIRLTEVETMDLPGGLGYRREDLPQIQKSDIPKFIRECQKRKIGCEAIRCLPSSLKPSQGHLNKDKVNALKGSEDNSPYLISKDRFIADGHHRWASKLVEGDTPVKCIKVGLPIHDLIKVMHAYQHSFTKEIHEGQGFRLGLMGKSPYKGHPCKNKTCKNDTNFKCLKCAMYVCANHAANMTTDWDCVCGKCKQDNSGFSGWQSIPARKKDGQ